MIKAESLEAGRYDAADRSSLRAPSKRRFRAFPVLPRRRELLADGQPVKLRDHPFDILLALLEAPGEVVGKAALRVRVCPNPTAEHLPKTKPVYTQV
jgi:DNA-binding response OmpR family regulator